MRMISKARAMAESAVRTFLQAALPAMGGALYATNGNVSKAVVVAALVAGVAAGLAAMARTLRPMQTDAANVQVEGVKTTKVVIK